METIFFGGTTIRFTKGFGKAIVGIKAIVHGNIDDTPAMCKLCGPISQASASDIFHNWYANIRVKHTIIVIRGETRNFCKFVYSDAVLQMLFNIINTVLDTRAIIHKFPLLIATSIIATEISFYWSIFALSH